MTGHVVFLSKITRDMLRLAPEARFVFGDNLRRQGMGGQAREMRGEPNAIGVPTKRAPSMAAYAFFSDESEEAWTAVNEAIAEVRAALDEGRIVYVPRDGIGTGLACLPQYAPRLYAHIVNAFRELAGEDIPWN